VWKRFIYTQEWLQLVKNSRKSSWIYLKQNPKHSSRKKKNKKWGEKKKTKKTKMNFFLLFFFSCFFWQAPPTRKKSQDTNPTLSTEADLTAKNWPWKPLKKFFFCYKSHCLFLQHISTFTLAFSSAVEFSSFFLLKKKN